MRPVTTFGLRIRKGKASFPQGLKMIARRGSTTAGTPSYAPFKIDAGLFRSNDSICGHRTHRSSWRTVVSVPDRMFSKHPYNEERVWLRAIAFHSNASRVNGCSCAHNRRRRRILGLDGIRGALPCPWSQTPILTYSRSHNGVDLPAIAVRDIAVAVPIESPVRSECAPSMPVRLTRLSPTSSASEARASTTRRQSG